MLLLCYPKCSTCRKAEKWLQEHQIDYTYRDIREENPTVEELKQWLQQSGYPVKKFVNTSGNLYKEMKLKDRIPDMTEEELLALLSTDGMLVKRPILVSEEWVLTGFREAEWQEKLSQ